MISSDQDAVWQVLTRLKNYPIQRCGYNVWEDYYAHQYQPHNIFELDLDSGMANEYGFIPRYIHPNYDSYTNEVKEEKIATLVSASGGLDSSTNLAVLKASGMNPIAVHFKYGHRGQDAEEAAIKSVTNKLEIPLIVLDIEANMKQIDNFSMLTNKDVEITTGTSDLIKTTTAWTCFRNGLFVSYMAAYAEGLILNQGYTKVYYTGGFMNLTESGVYPDNSERFIQAFENFCKLASIVSDRIQPLYGLSNLLKTDQLLLLEYMGMYDELGPLLISCDDPIVDANNGPRNCCKLRRRADGVQEIIPMCGSGLLSYWAVKKAGLEDNRQYYIKNTNAEIYDRDMKPMNEYPSFAKIIDKIQIPDEYKDNLRKLNKLI
jgi:7-cyano-7-deazaguanine synthase